MAGRLEIATKVIILWGRVVESLKQLRSPIFVELDTLPQILPQLRRGLGVESRILIPRRSKPFALGHADRWRSVSSLCGHLYTQIVALAFHLIFCLNLLAGAAFGIYELRMEDL